MSVRSLLGPARGPSGSHSHAEPIRTGPTGEDGSMDARDLIDDLAEVLVVPSFTRTGFRLRRRLHAWPEAESYSMAGRTVVLTGPTSGLGRAAAGAFARMGARLVLVGRDAGRLERTRNELVVKTPGVSASTVVADMASLASVRAAAAEILTSAPRLDVIVDNAGPE